MMRLAALAALMLTMLMPLKASAQHSRPRTAKPPQPAARSQATEPTAEPAEEPAPNAAETVQERYSSGKLKVSRQVALDQSGNFVNHGAWKLYSEAGQLIAEGQFEKGKRVGHWTKWHQTADSKTLQQAPFNHFRPPFKSEADFVNDRMEGEWLVTDALGRKCLSITLSDGKRHGQTTAWQPDGKSYRQASYQSGVPVGEVLELDPKTGEPKPIATYVDGKKLTTKTVNYPRTNHKLSEEHLLEPPLLEASPDDFWTLTLAKYSAEGTPVRHGVYRSWHANGQLQQQGEFAQGRREGAFIYYHENGQIAAKGKFVHDQPEGPWGWWHENGQRASSGHYHEGAVVDQWRWWNEDGTLARQTNHTATEPHPLLDDREPRMASLPDGPQLK